MYIQNKKNFLRVTLILIFGVLFTLAACDAPAPDTPDNGGGNGGSGDIGSGDIGSPTTNPSFNPVKILSVTNSAAE